MYGINYFFTINDTLEYFALAMWKLLLQTSKSFFRRQQSWCRHFGWWISWISQGTKNSICRSINMPWNQYRKKQMVIDHVIKFYHSAVIYYKIHIIKWKIFLRKKVTTDLNKRIFLVILLEFVLDIFDHDPYHSNDGNDEGSKCESAKMVSTNSKNIFDL